MRIQTPVCIMSLACHHQPKWKGQRQGGGLLATFCNPQGPPPSDPCLLKFNSPHDGGGVGGGSRRGARRSQPAHTFQPPGKGSAGGSERCLRASVTPSSRPRKLRCLKTWTQRLGCTSVSAPSPGTYPLNPCKFLSGLNIGSIILSTRRLSGAGASWSPWLQARISSPPPHILLRGAGGWGGNGLHVGDPCCATPACAASR